MLYKDPVTLHSFIELICQKLKNSVTPTEVLRWLLNFKEEEQPYLIEILMLHEHLNSNEIFNSYNSSFKKILSTIPIKQNIILHPIGEYGKSGTSMFYYAKKAIKEFQNKYSINYYENYRKFKVNKKALEKMDNLSLFLIDDIYGSGNSALNYFSTYVNPQIEKINNIKVYFISLVCLHEAKNRIESAYSYAEVISEMFRRKLFSPENIKVMFTNINNMKKTRQICFDYGQKLFLDKEENNKPLGYENSQALISFCFGTPNNTLPIMWSSLNKWYPLFPRFIDDKISSAKEYRKEVAFWLAIARVFGITEFTSYDEDKGITLIGKDNFQLFAFIKLTIEKADKSTICHRLGIFEQDYKLILEDALENKYITINGNITHSGYMIYGEVQNAVKKFKHNQVSVLNTEIKSVDTPRYYPLSFRGIK